MLDYSSAEYWEERYLREPGTFDWYQGWHGLRRLLEAHVPKDAHILQVGVGTSKLQEDMVTLGGYESVTNIDVSTVAIEHMRELHRGIPQLRYEVADACDLEAFPDASFGAVLDKGTMDALACGPHSSERCAAMVEECARVLRPLGVMVVVTYGDPISRLAHFLSPEYRMWEDIEVYVLSKPPQVVDPTGSVLGSMPETQPNISGPYSHLSTDLMERLSIQDNVHFVYVLTRTCEKDHNEGLDEGVNL